MHGLISRARSLWRGLRKPGQLDAEMDEEMRFHIDMEAERLVRERGLDPVEARRRAAIAFGGVEKHKEQGRDARGVTWLYGLSLDFRLGARMLAKYPGLTLVGGLSMAVAIAVGAATFELVTQTLDPRLPLDGGARVVGIRNWDARENDIDPRVAHDFAAWRQEVRSVDDLGAFRTVTRNLIAADGTAEPVYVAEMSASGFRVARVEPLLGRYLVDEDERAEAPPVAVIGYDVWRSRFGGDPAVVGRTVQVGRATATVVGVMPKGFAFPVSHGVWMPLRLNVLDYPRGQGPALTVFGRLADGVSMEAAGTELATLGARAAADHPETHRDLRTQVLPYAKAWSPLQGDGVPWSVIVAAGYSVNASAVMFLLLVCANVATLVFARTATRESEIAVRSALGASRGRIAMQLFAEALVLGAVAAALGLAVAAGGLRWALGVFETVVMDLPFWFSARISPRTVLYAAGLTVIAAMVAGVIPALKITGRGMQARLRQAGVGGSGPRFGRLWTGIIVTQVALTVVFVPIVIITALDIREIRTPQVGFAAREYLAARIEMDRDAPGTSADTSGAAFDARLLASYGELERRLAAEPGVAAVTYAGRVPGAYHPRYPIEVEGGAAPQHKEPAHRVQRGRVGPGFFDALGAPILAGRGFQPGDAEPGATAVIVNEDFVRVVLGGRNAVGRRVRYVEGEDDDVAPRDGRWMEIVGVVRQVALTVDPDLPHAAGIYHPIPPTGDNALYVAMRVSGGTPGDFAPRLRALALAVDPALRLYEVHPLDQAQRGLLMTYTFWVGVAAVAACIVLLLSTTGIYSLMSFTVARRTREIGIRIALGADRRRIVWGIFSRAFTQVGIGIALGTLILFAMAGGVQSLGEAALLGTCVVLMTGVCVLACIVPTRRALAVEPTEAIRAEA